MKVNEWGNDMIHPLSIREEMAGGQSGASW